MIHTGLQCHIRKLWHSEHLTLTAGGSLQEESAVFDQAMTATSIHQGKAVASAFDFSRYAVVVVAQDVD